MERPQQNFEDLVNIHCDVTTCAISTTVKLAIGRGDRKSAFDDPNVLFGNEKLRGWCGLERLD